jgi:signal transduction histidine kinase
LISSANGRVTDFNAAASALFGGSGVIDQRSVQELLPFIPQTAWGASQDTTWRGQILDPDGRALDLEVSGTSLTNAVPEARVIYVIHDISPQMEANRLAEQLLYCVAHELSGPLTTLRSSLDILSSGAGELAVREFDQLLQGARRTSARLAILVEDWLSAGTIRSGRLRVQQRPTQLSAVIDEAAAIVSPVVAARGQRLEQDLQSADLCVLADRRYLRQVFSNLLDNAAKYSPVGEVIQIRASESDGCVRVSVEDHGPGIPAEQRDSVFEWFHRLAPDNSASGTGLGLAIARAIVQAHGGTIAVDKEIVNGTGICFTLPAAEGSRQR